MCNFAFLSHSLFSLALKSVAADDALCVECPNTYLEYFAADLVAACCKVAHNVAPSSPLCVVLAGAEAGATSTSTGQSQIHITQLRFK